MWGGGKSPLSSELSNSVREMIEQFRLGQCREPEMKAMKGILTRQADWSHLPSFSDFLIERTLSREGTHWFVFPFAGRLAPALLELYILCFAGLLPPVRLGRGFTLPGSVNIVNALL